MSDTLQLQRTFITWLLATQGAVITSIGIATGLVLGFG
jgi:predicted lysophospholipase L1 biosynthesis ABC-type transport system permease subunit